MASAKPGRSFHSPPELPSAFERDPSPVSYGMLINTLSGIAGGVAAVLVGQPLDTVKVKMQLFPKKYSGMVDCLQKTVKAQNFYGLYAGTMPALVSCCTENAILFGAYGRCQLAIASLRDCDAKDLNWKENAAAGGISSLVSSLVLCPTELVKIRMQGYGNTQDDKSKPKHMTAGTIMKDIWKKNGCKGFYRGLWATMAREVVGSTAFFGTYELSREQMTPAGKRKEDIDNVYTMAAGALSGVAMWLPSYPMDVIKSRVQMSERGNNGGYRAVWTTVGSLRALYCGLWPTIVKSIPVSSVLLITVELTKRLLSDSFPPSRSDDQPTIDSSTSSPPKSKASDSTSQK